MRSWFAVMLAARFAAGCSGNAPPACITVDPACAPQYLPTFDNVFDNTIKLGCGSARSSCHARGGASGMSLEDPQIAHASLLAGRVTPGDPGCSEMIVRTSSPGEDYAMPPGTSLSAPERCALIKWVADGAPGPTQAAAAAGSGAAP